MEATARKNTWNGVERRVKRAETHAKAGFLEVYYTDHLAFIEDYIKEIKHGRLTINTVEQIFAKEEYVDIEVNLPHSLMSFKLVGKVLEVQSARNEDLVEVCTLKVKLEAIPRSAQEVLVNYLKDLFRIDLALVADKKSDRLENNPWLRAVQFEKAGNAEDLPENRPHIVDLAAGLYVAKQNAEGRIKEISPCGAKLVSDAMMLAGTKVNCLVFLPDLKRIYVSAEIDAEITHEAGQYTYSLLFKDFEANSKFELLNYLKKLEEESDLLFATLSRTMNMDRTMDKEERQYS